MARDHGTNCLFFTLSRLLSDSGIIVTTRRTDAPSLSRLVVQMLHHCHDSSYRCSIIVTTPQIIKMLPPCHVSRLVHRSYSCTWSARWFAMDDGNRRMVPLVGMMVRADQLWTMVRYGRCGPLVGTMVRGTSMFNTRPMVRCPVSPHRYSTWSARIRWNRFSPQVQYLPHTRPVSPHRYSTWSARIMSRFSP